MTLKFTFQIYLSDRNLGDFRKVCFSCIYLHIIICILYFELNQSLHLEHYFDILTCNCIYGLWKITYAYVKENCLCMVVNTAWHGNPRKEINLFNFHKDIRMFHSSLRPIETKMQQLNFSKCWHRENYILHFKFSSNLPSTHWNFTVGLFYRWIKMRLL